MATTCSEYRRCGFIDPQTWEPCREELVCSRVTHTVTGGNHVFAACPVHQVSGIQTRGTDADSNPTPRDGVQEERSHLTDGSGTMRVWLDSGGTILATFDSSKVELISGRLQKVGSAPLVQDPGSSGSVKHYPIIGYFDTNQTPDEATKDPEFVRCPDFGPCRIRIIDRKHAVNHAHYTGEYSAKQVEDIHVSYRERILRLLHRYNTRVEQIRRLNEEIDEYRVREREIRAAVNQIYGAEKE